MIDRACGTTVSSFTAVSLECEPFPRDVQKLLVGKLPLPAVRRHRHGKLPGKTCVGPHRVNFRDPTEPERFRKLKL